MKIAELFDFSSVETAPYGSDVSAGTYECADCGYEITTQSVKSLPPCPDFQESTHKVKGWKIRSGADAKDDPYPAA
jgi:hypothetical protein